MDFIIWLFVCSGFFFLGFCVRSLIMTAGGKKKPAISGPVKPVNKYSDYTIEELEKHKKYLEREYKETLHYPVLRRYAAEDLKEVFHLLDYHYTVDGTYALKEQRDKNRRDLEEFDQQYAAILGGK